MRLTAFACGCSSGRAYEVVRMKQQHVVLRGLKSPLYSDFRDGPRTGTSETHPLTLAREELDGREATRLAQEADVAAIAPIMPMRLVRPVQRSAANSGPATKVAWGVRAVRADTSPFSGAGIAVALLDTGIDKTHPAFFGGTAQIVERDFTGEGNGDNDGHGTHCAGVIFGGTVMDQRISVAPGISRALIGKVLAKEGGSSDSIIEAILWAADQGAQVISMSLGMDFPGFVRHMVEQRQLPVELATSVALEAYRANVLLFERLASFIRARRQPVLLVAAAGNESRRDLDPGFDIAVSPPAVSDGFISVAALGSAPDGFYAADFSNTGANVSAPGVDIVSADLKQGLAIMSGTSMAAPHVAGIAALWAEKLQRRGLLSWKNLSADVVSNSTLDPMHSKVNPDHLGHGIVQAPQN
jgi:subtilisin family serine protease